MNTRIIVKFLGSLLLSTMLILASCKKEEALDPITLAYTASGSTFDNQERQLNVYAFSESLPLFIFGGDGNYRIINGNKKVVDYDFDGKIIKFKSVSVGSATITIEDNAGNKYELLIDVIVEPNSNYGHIKSTWALVRGENMTDSEKAELRSKVIADAPVGWQFIFTTPNKAGIARAYQGEYAGASYNEYAFEVEGEIPDDQKPYLVPHQILTWFSLKSENEDMFLVFSDPVKLDDGSSTYFVCCVRDVTKRYKAQYPTLERAYEVQSYLGR